MARIVMYGHGGSGNHGCEAIVRSTIDVLNNKNMFLISSNPEEDRRYGVSDWCQVVKEYDEKPSMLSKQFWQAYYALKINKNFIPMDKLHYLKAFDNIMPGDIALSIGGDNYCYADVRRHVMLHELAISRGAKTVLWGCSVEPSIIEEETIKQDLEKYDLITARESISFEALKRINPNTMLVSDTAFKLRESECVLPKGFQDGNTVGINLSPMVIDEEKYSEIVFKNYIHLIKSILSSTDMSVALIPHVIWENNDDREPLQKLYDLFKDNSRLCIVKDHNCMELKHIISKCRFFVGARTHATIAAYSSFIPTLVLGYSVKSIGIAKDLFGSSDNYVVHVKNTCKEDDLSSKFNYLLSNEKEIKKHLINIMPEYCALSSIRLEELI
ncbi:MAG: polysaccharide pyruvyl transferase family protein [Erysipelotrichaceae bacterium]|nr:polysaccharide pyruvyl transferase family protein [Clostridia bacterium]MBQ6217760.1 polysaccharide pyruvyl transferase family protein [Erysipelotrichaceae bacterium]